MEVLTAVFASLLTLAGAVVVAATLYAPSRPPHEPDDVVLLVGSVGVVFGVFVLTVLAVAA